MGVAAFSNATVQSGGLVAGAGVAGLAAALRAALPGARVLMVERRIERHSSGFFNWALVSRRHAAHFAAQQARR